MSKFFVYDRYGLGFVEVDNEQDARDIVRGKETIYRNLQQEQALEYLYWGEIRGHVGSIDMDNGERFEVYETDRDK